MVKLQFNISNDRITIHFDKQEARLRVGNALSQCDLADGQLTADYYELGRKTRVSFDDKQNGIIVHVPEDVKQALSKAMATTQDEASIDRYADNIRSHASQQQQNTPFSIASGMLEANKVATGLLAPSSGV